MTVIQNPFPTSEITSSDVEICTGTSTDVSISFTGVAPYTFTYTDGTTPVTIYNFEEDNYNISASENGTYEVTYLKGGGGCVGTDLTGIANISVNALPSSVINIDNTVICEGETTDIPINFTGNAPWTFTYSIDGIDQAPITTSDNPYVLNTGIGGEYAVTALSDASLTGECFTGTTQVTVTPLPTSNIISNDVTTCENETTNITIELTGEAPWDLTYTLDGINPVTIYDIYTNPYSLTVQDSGLYEITALSGKSCDGTVFNGNCIVTANPLPTATIIEGNTEFMVREGETMDFNLELTGEAPWTYTYVIDLENPVAITTSNSSNTITSSIEGTYEIVEVSDVNCTNYWSDGYPDIKYDPSPTSLISCDDTLICGADSTEIQIDLTGVAPWSITYTVDGENPTEINTSETPFILEVSNPALYKVTKLSDAELEGSQMLGEALITAKPLPFINLGVDTAICENARITLNSGSYSEYLWNNGSNTQTIVVDSEGTYSVIITDENNCENSDEILVHVNPVPVSDFTFTENNLEVNFTNTSLNANTFMWDFGDSKTSTDMNQTHTYSDPGNYNVVLTSSNLECGDSITTKTVSAISTSIANNQFKNDINVYPNPTAGIVTIEFDNQQMLGSILEIRNIAGQRVYYKKIDSKQFTEKIDLSNQAKGIYALNILFKDHIYSKKIILSK